MSAFIKMLISPSKWGLIVRTYEKSKFDAEFNISWSQSGEDLASVADEQVQNTKELREFFNKSFEI